MSGSIYFSRDLFLLVPINPYLSRQAKTNPNNPPVHIINLLDKVVN